MDTCLCPPVCMLALLVWMEPSARGIHVKADALKPVTKMRANCASSKHKTACTSAMGGPRTRAGVAAPPPLFRGAQQTHNPRTRAAVAAQPPFFRGAQLTRNPRRRAAAAAPPPLFRGAQQKHTLWHDVDALDRRARCSAPAHVLVAALHILAGRPLQRAPQAALLCTHMDGKEACEVRLGWQTTAARTPSCPPLHTQ
eukprot:351380-Pelagomonas_calceolata.AAC.1